MAQYNGWNINTGFLDGNIVPNDGFHYDKDALGRHYAQELETRVTAAFPGADVTVRHQPDEGCIPFDCQTRAIPQDEGDYDGAVNAESVIDNIHSAIYEAIVWDEFVEAGE